MVLPLRPLPQLRTTPCEPLTACIQGSTRQRAPHSRCLLPPLASTTTCCGRNHNPCCGAITATAGNSARCHTLTCGRRLPCFFHTLNFSKLDSCAKASLTVRRETLHLRWRHTRNCGLARDMEVLERLLQEHKSRLLLHGQQYDASATSSPLAPSPCVFRRVCFSIALTITVNASFTPQ